MGGSFLSMLNLRFNHDNKYLNLFMDQVAGMIILVTLYSSVITSLKTINIFFILSIVYIIYRNYNHLIYKPTDYTIILSELLNHCFTIIKFSLPIYILLVYFNFNSELELLFPNIDNWYYAQQSANMFYSGIENGNSIGQIFIDENMPNTPYHYFDLWFISIFCGYW